MNRSEISFKIGSLLRMAEVTADHISREQYLKEAKMMLDMIDPNVTVINDDPVYSFITSFYKITCDPKDQISKIDFDHAFYEWYEGEEVISKKSLQSRAMKYGLDISRRGTADGRKGIYTYRGIKKLNS